MTEGVPQPPACDLTYSASCAPLKPLMAWHEGLTSTEVKNFLCPGGEGFGAVLLRGEASKICGEKFFEASDSGGGAVCGKFVW